MNEIVLTRPLFGSRKVAARQTATLPAAKASAPRRVFSAGPVRV